MSLAYSPEYSDLSCNVAPKGPIEPAISASPI